MYVGENFDKSARNSGKKLFQDVQDIFIEILDELDWMDDKTRIRAKGKTAAMTTHTAYPDELFNDKKLTERYANVFIN